MPYARYKSRAVLCFVRSVPRTDVTFIFRLTKIWSCFYCCHGSSESPLPSTSTGRLVRPASCCVALERPQRGLSRSAKLFRTRLLQTERTLPRILDPESRRNGLLLSPQDQQQPLILPHVLRTTSRPPLLKLCRWAARQVTGIPRVTSHRPSPRPMSCFSPTAQYPSLSALRVRALVLRWPPSLWRRRR